jgi:hypothetical protein
MTKDFYARPVPLDRVRAEMVLDHRLFTADLPVSGLAEEVERYESLLGIEPERMAAMRGTLEGMMTAAEVAPRLADRGEGMTLLLGVLWALAHGPEGGGWPALDGLGGQIVRATPLDGLCGWMIETCQPVE